MLLVRGSAGMDAKEKSTYPCTGGGLFATHGRCLTRHQPRFPRRFCSVQPRSRKNKHATSARDGAGGRAAANQHEAAGTRAVREAMVIMGHGMQLVANGGGKAWRWPPPLPFNFVSACMGCCAMLVAN